MRFCTVVNCLDGRTQIPVIEYLKSRYRVDYVDIISEPGPNRILAEAKEKVTIDSIERRVRLSLDRHDSVGIAVAGHHDCAGNPAPQEKQEAHIRMAVKKVREMFTEVPVIGLWVGSNWQVTELEI